MSFTLPSDVFGARWQRVIDIADPHRQVAVGPISAGGVLIVANRALVFPQQADSQETTHAETRLGIVLAEV